MKASTWKLKEFSTALVPLYDSEKKVYSVFTSDAEEIEVPESLFKKLFVPSEIEVEEMKEFEPINPIEKAFQSMDREQQEKFMGTIGMDVDKVYEDMKEQTKRHLRENKMWDVLKSQVKAVIRSGGNAESLKMITSMIIPLGLTGREKEMFASLVDENIEEAKREEGV